MATTRVDSEGGTMNKINLTVLSVLLDNLRKGLLLLVLAFSSASFAQSVLSDSPSLLSGSKTGKLEEIHESDNFMTISGRNYDFHNDTIEVYYEGKRVRTHFLNEGLVLRFVLDTDGVLAKIEILGPVDLIVALEES